MIIKGNAAGSIKFWSKHLLRDDTNSRADVVEISGLMAEDLPYALKEMKAVADQSRCRGKFMYQANINPRANERLTEEQWNEAVDTLEKNLGLKGHQRIVIEHEKEGRVHRHVVWNRVDVDTLRVIDIGGNYYTHQRTARELEKKFGLEHTQSLHGQRRDEGRPERPPESWEQRNARHSKIDPQQLKEELTELWRDSDNGREFRTAIEECGYILAKGDRRDFCVVDPAGDVHSLARRLGGVKAKDVRERMADVDRDLLPTVAEAREKRAAYAKDQAEARTTESRDVKAEAERDRTDEFKPREAVHSAIFVADAATGTAMGLVDFVGKLFTSGQRRQPTTPEGRSQIERILAERRAAAALENIRDSMERGENLRPSDIMRLTDSHLENIRLRGDDYMHELVSGIQRSRERESDWGRERER